MGLSWNELQRTPVYVRRFTWDCLAARHEAEAQSNDGGQQYGGVVERRVKR